MALQKRCKRVSFCFLFRKNDSMKKYKGSMTVEAAFVFPMFMFAIINLISIIDVYRIQSMTSARLYEVVKNEAVVSSSEYAEACGIDDIKPMIGMMGFNRFLLFSRMRTKSWNGYDNTKQSEDEEMVYITPNGSVYHMSIACTYLKLSIESINIKDLSNKRNQNGSRYTECSSCGGKKINTVYITNYGDKYHTSLECSKLKRTIEQVPISQVGGRGACSKCGD